MLLKTRLCRQRPLKMHLPIHLSILFKLVLGRGPMQSVPNVVQDMSGRLRYVEHGDEEREEPS